MLKNKHLILLAYLLLAFSYAGWQGNAKAVSEAVFHNSKGERIYPVVAKKMEEVAALGGSQYYTGADGQRYTDINTFNELHFNWNEFWRISTFSIGFLLLILIVINLSNRFSTTTEQ